MLPGTSKIHVPQGYQHGPIPSLEPVVFHRSVDPFPPSTGPVIVSVRGNVVDDRRQNFGLQSLDCHPNLHRELVNRQLQPLTAHRNVLKTGTEFLQPSGKATVSPTNGNVPYRPVYDVHPKVLCSSKDSCLRFEPGDKCYLQQSPNAFQLTLSPLRPEMTSNTEIANGKAARSSESNSPKPIFPIQVNNNVQIQLAATVQSIQENNVLRCQRQNGVPLRVNASCHDPRNGKGIVNHHMEIVTVNGIKTNYVNSSVNNNKINNSDHCVKISVPCQGSYVVPKGHNQRTAQGQIPNPDDNSKSERMATNGLLLSTDNVRRERSVEAIVSHAPENTAPLRLVSNCSNVHARMSPNSQENDVQYSIQISNAFQPRSHQRYYESPNHDNSVSPSQYSNAPYKTPVSASPSQYGNAFQGHVIREWYCKRFDDSHNQIKHGNSHVTISNGAYRQSNNVSHQKKHENLRVGASNISLSQSINTPSRLQILPKRIPNKNIPQIMVPNSVIEYSSVESALQCSSRLNAGHGCTGMLNATRRNDSISDVSQSPGETDNCYALMPRGTDNHNAFMPKEMENHSVFMSGETEHYSALMPRETDNHSALMPRKVDNDSAFMSREMDNYSAFFHRETDNHGAFIPREMGNHRACISNETRHQSAIMLIETDIDSAILPIEIDNDSVFIPRETDNNMSRETDNNGALTPREKDNHSAFMPRGTNNHSALMSRETDNHIALMPRETDNHSALMPRERDNHSVLMSRETDNHSVLMSRETDNHIALMPTERDHHGALVSGLGSIASIQGSSSKTVNPPPLIEVPLSSGNTAFFTPDSDDQHRGSNPQTCKDTSSQISGPATEEEMDPFLVGVLDDINREKNHFGNMMTKVSLQKLTDNLSWTSFEKAANEVVRPTLLSRLPTPQTDGTPEGSSVTQVKVFQRDRTAKCEGVSCKELPEKDILISDSELYKCGLCGGHVFDSVYNLIAHYVHTHPECQTLPCPHCHALLKRQRLPRHMELRHKNSEGLRFFCGGLTSGEWNCFDSFTSLHKLWVHINANHTNETEFHCEQCDKTFETNKSYILHYKTVFVVKGGQPTSPNSCKRRRVYARFKVGQYESGNEIAPQQNETVDQDYGKKRNYNEQDQAGEDDVTAKPHYDDQDRENRVFEKHGNHNQTCERETEILEKQRNTNYMATNSSSLYKTMESALLRPHMMPSIILDRTDIQSVVSRNDSKSSRRQAGHGKAAQRLKAWQHKNIYQDGQNENYISEKQNPSNQDCEEENDIFYQNCNHNNGMSEKDNQHKPSKPNSTLRGHDSERNACVDIGDKNVSVTSSRKMPDLIYVPRKRQVHIKVVGMKEEQVQTIRTSPLLGVMEALDGILLMDRRKRRHQHEDPVKRKELKIDTSEEIAEKPIFGSLAKSRPPTSRAPKSRPSTSRRPTSRAQKSRRRRRRASRSHTRQVAPKTESKTEILPSDTWKDFLWRNKDIFDDETNERRQDPDDSSEDDDVDEDDETGDQISPSSGTSATPLFLDDLDYTCGICSLTYNSIVLFRLHLTCHAASRASLATVDPTSRPRRCGLCDDRLDSDSDLGNTQSPVRKTRIQKELSRVEKNSSGSTSSRIVINLNSSTREQGLDNRPSEEYSRKPMPPHNFNHNHYHSSGIKSQSSFSRSVDFYRGMMASLYPHVQVCRNNRLMCTP